MVLEPCMQNAKGFAQSHVPSNGFVSCLTNSRKCSIECHFEHGGVWRLQPFFIFRWDDCLALVRKWNEWLRSQPHASNCKNSTFCSPSTSGKNSTKDLLLLGCSLSNCKMMSSEPPNRKRNLDKRNTSSLDALFHLLPLVACRVAVYIKPWLPSQKHEPTVTICASMLALPV